MALKYVVKKTVFGFDESKTPKYVARPLLAGTVSYSEICNQVTKVGMAPRGVVKMVIDGLIDALEWNLANHLSVKLGDFGTLRPAFGSKSQEEEKDVNADVLRHRKIIFTAGTHFREMLRKVSIQKFEIPKTDETGSGSGSGGGSEDRPEIE